MRLNYQFYQNHVVDVAYNLIGKKIILGNFEGVITETEAYGGYDDPASHAYGGVTNRSAIMFGEPGYSYVYMIYGMYYCLNIVTEPAGQASAVLIRGLKLPNLHLNGPGKICRHLGIDKKDNGINLLTSDNFYLTDGITYHKISSTKRVGIKKAVDFLWRFVANLDEVL